jgi:seryl-tRNA synthetase
MRAKVDELNVERARLEQQLNKALPKGKVMSHLLREREETEAQFNEISKVIAKLNLDIRHAGAR